MKENFLFLLPLEGTEPLVTTVTCTELLKGRSVEKNKENSVIHVSSFPIYAMRYNSGHTNSFINTIFIIIVIIIVITEQWNIVWLQVLCVRAHNVHTKNRKNRKQNEKDNSSFVDLLTSRHCDWLSCFRATSPVMWLAESVCINHHTFSSIFPFSQFLNTLCCCETNNALCL